MKSTSNDPRAIRTRQALRDGLMQTVIEKPFREMTVNDITDSGGVNRATFYLHYEDKYDLLEDCANNLFEEIRTQIELQSVDIRQTEERVPYDAHYKRMMIILGHFQKNRAFYLTMMGNKGDPLFYNLFRDGASVWITKMLTTVMEQNNQPVNQEVLDMMVRFQSAGNFDVMMWWLEQDERIPIDIIAHQLAEITLPPLIRLIKGEDYKY